MFEIDRSFCQRNTRTGLMEWFFNTREGVFGPYDTKQMAQKELKVFVDRRKASGDDGGRSAKEKGAKEKGRTKLTIAPIEHEPTETIFYDYDKKRKGLEE